MASIGAVCGRIPGSPRLARLQMSLILFPLAAGGLCAADPVVHLIVALAPIYILALDSINLQLHDDYVEMVVGRQENRRLALRCPLTALPNRRMFDATLATVLHSAAGRGVDAFVLCLDLDGFKVVNDQLGHAAGDLLLKEVAARLLRSLPADGLVARIGGDEFAILITAPYPAIAEALAGSIVTAVDQPVELDGRFARVGVSIGISSGGDAENPERLIREADQALYAAKSAGKNTFRWYETPPSLTETFGQQRRSTDDALHELRIALESPLPCCPASEPCYLEDAVEAGVEAA